MFSLVNVRLQTDDRTSRAIIRDVALRLFADHGPDGVTVRQIAGAAKVSPALVVRHFGSKDGLREAVDAHVVRIIEAALKVLAQKSSPTSDNLQSVVEAVVQYFPSDSAIPGYVRRLLLDGSRTGRVLFHRLFAVGQTTVNELLKAGLAVPGADPTVRTAFLMANDLAVLLLRDHLTELLGVDPFSAPGMKRWAGEVLAIYSSGLGASGVVHKTRESQPVQSGNKVIRGGKR